MLSMNWAAWQRMLALALALLAGLKWLSWRLAVGQGSAAGAGRTLGYLLAWPGMDAKAFLDRGKRVNAPARTQWARAALRILAGVAVIAVVARWVPTMTPLVAGWLGIAGLLLLFHFGLFDLVSLAWRTAGVDAAPIMRRPWAARTLGEFWGQRWNLAFRQVAYDAVYRPLVGRIGARWALVAVFVFSALLHELAISLPARGGWGLPSGYFLLQAAGVLAAGSRLGRRLGIQRGRRARLFAWLLVVGPAPLLFHPPFAIRVIGGLLRAIGAS